MRQGHLGRALACCLNIENRPIHGWRICGGYQGAKVIVDRAAHRTTGHGRLAVADYDAAANRCADADQCAIGCGLSRIAKDGIRRPTRANAGFRSGDDAEICLR